jgi:hypothetical protein
VEVAGVPGMNQPRTDGAAIGVSIDIMADTLGIFVVIYLVIPLGRELADTREAVAGDGGSTRRPRVASHLECCFQRTQTQRIVLRSSRSSLAMVP